MLFFNFTKNQRNANGHKSGVFFGFVWLRFAFIIVAKTIFSLIFASDQNICGCDGFYGLFRLASSSSWYLRNRTKVPKCTSMRGRGVFFAALLFFFVPNMSLFMAMRSGYTHVWWKIKAQTYILWMSVSCAIYATSWFSVCRIHFHFCANIHNLLTLSYDDDGFFSFVAAELLHNHRIWNTNTHRIHWLSWPSRIE